MLIPNWAVGLETHPAGFTLLTEIHLTLTTGEEVIHPKVSLLFLPTSEPGKVLVDAALSISADLGAMVGFTVDATDANVASREAWTDEAITRLTLACRASLA